MFKIEAGISVPEFTQQRNWPFKNMEIGQSFLLERPSDDLQFDGSTAMGVLKKARGAANSTARSKGWTFRSAWEPSGLRFWRVS